MWRNQHPILFDSTFDSISCHCPSDPTHTFARAAPPRQVDGEQALLHKHRQQIERLRARLSQMHVMPMDPRDAEAAANEQVFARVRPVPFLHN